MKKLATILIIALAGCSTIRDAHQPTVHHVVLCWLKDSGNATQRRQIMEVSRSFKRIPGVLDVRVGEVMESDRTIVDDSFDVAISLSFADRQSLTEYLAHPVHKKATREVLLPLVNKIVVYNFKE